LLSNGLGECSPSSQICQALIFELRGENDFGLILREPLLAVYFRGESSDPRACKRAQSKPIGLVVYVMDGSAHRRGEHVCCFQGSYSRKNLAGSVLSGKPNGCATSALSKAKLCGISATQCTTNLILTVWPGSTATSSG
jgi:hypothetical protein